MQRGDLTLYSFPSSVIERDIRGFNYIYYVFTLFMYNFLNLLTHLPNYLITYLVPILGPIDIFRSNPRGSQHEKP